MNKWETVSLPEVLFFQEGPGVRNTQYTASGVKLLNVANLQDGNVDLSTSSRYISEAEAYGKYKHFLVNDGDLIIASSGIQIDYFDKKMGFVNSSHLPLCMNTSTIRFKSLDKNKLYLKYFMYFLKTDNFKIQLSKHITGSAQLNFGPSHIKQMEMPLPPLPEQQKIAATLDKVNFLMNARKKQLLSLDSLIKSRFIEMFGDPVENEKGFPIYSLPKFYANTKSAVKCGPFGSALKKEEFCDSGIPVWNMDNISKRNTFISSPNLWVSVEKFFQLKSYAVEQGDIIISRAGTVGKMCVVNSPYQQSLISTNLIRLRLNSQLLSGYIVMLMTIYGNKVCRLKTGQDGSFTYMNTDVLNSISFPYPPISLQTRFADFVQKVEKSKQNLQQSLNKLELLNNALMQKYFG